VAVPEKPHSDVAILICTDVIGHRFSNVALIADQFAANGYPTYIPDILNGDPIPLNRPEGFDLSFWLTGKPYPANPSGSPGHLPNVTEPVVKKLLAWLRGEGGYKKIGIVGYCFGAKYVIRALGDGGADVGYVAHPSFVEAEEVEAIKGPLSISAAETDQIFPAEKRHETEKILIQTKQAYQINLYSGVAHGFAVRADLSEKQARYAKEQAFYQAVAWFDEWLKE